MRALYLIPYSKLAPPENGGQLRCYHLARVLSQSIPVDLVSWQDPEVIEISFRKRQDSSSGGVECHQIPKKPPPPRMIQRGLDAARFRLLNRSFQGPAQSFLIESHQLLKSLCADNDYNAVVFEHLETLSAARYLRRLLPDALFLYDAHNVDSQLLEDEMMAQEATKQSPNRALSLTARLETSLHNLVDGVLCCSGKDRDQFQRMNSEALCLHLIPNGVDVDRKPFDREAKAKPAKPLIFCGDLRTDANRMGLLWFLKKILPQVWESDPTVSINIVGAGSELSCFDAFKADSRLVWKGLLPELNSVYTNSSIAVVPLTIGSGTRLKALEAMSYGNPVVSTAKGVEGLEVTDSENICIADEAADFAKQVIHLRNTMDRFQTVREKARVLVEQNYSWDSIGKKLAHLIVHGSPA